jgi:hypothetical protein
VKFHKKPEPVEAVCYQGRGDTIRVVNWLSLLEANVGGWLFHDDDITVPTPEGDRKALKGDWIVRDGRGDFLVRGPMTFKATYDPAD